MNDLLQQLIGIAPSVGMGVSGKGGAAKAFMDAYQRTNQMMDEKERLHQHDQIAKQDRDRTISRQAEQDRVAAEQRTNAATQQTQADALQKLQIPGQLAEAGGTAETPDDAKRLIESLMPSLMNAFGQDTMALGQPAVEMASRAITGRQKRQMKEFVDKLVGTSFVADNPEADPEIANLPEHVVKMLGKPTAKLSELQQFAELPVGKPQGKTAAGSFEEYANPKTPPERKAQIEADRKRYMQADDKPTVNVTLPNGVPTKIGDYALKLQDDYSRDSKPYLTMREAYQRVTSAKPDAAGDLSLIFAYMKVLDPNSVVREREFANAQNAAGVPDRVRNLYNQVMQGTRLNPEQRRQFQEQAGSIFENAKTNQRQVRGTYSTRAKQLGVPDNMVVDAEDEFLGAVAKPTFKVGQTIRNKKTGELGEVTGVRPDGSPIVRPKQ